MKIRIKNLYECVFVGKDTSRVIHVVGTSYSSAEFIAKSTVSNWEDKDAFELVCIRFMHIVSSKY